MVGVAAMAKSVTNGAAGGGAAAPTTFPKILIANISSLKDNVPVTFNYPLQNEPSLLVKVGQTAEGGIGPNNDIVAFSNICQHLGCIYGFQAPGTSPPCNSSYVAKQPMGYCCCHGSQYDFLEGAKVIGGPAPRPVPMVKLELDSSGNIYAIGMDPPVIYGHGSPGSTDVTTDLQGGTLVTATSGGQA
ncbi:MAG: Rieske 2Fe-2S domain-containing protein [Nitrososphaerota archaeon]|nr:Rieske 2Fe-2S domain-containing protein [Nitrososphaerota archaeon]MDG6967350.1 Rieske 2Fe-2S domain-containing protein [Nitrososphaerota archaeon]MDG6978428.1 Rieske 2Fe-2S domain-containing protein [Nitrososphaerota archaeon]MDG6981157.1 Rieske 2Fe-2S domain-containing protein [Nitrososphaerota archaeon]